MTIRKHTGTRCRQAGGFLLATAICVLSNVSFSEESNLTLDRILALPAQEVPVWKRYLEESQKRMAADKEFFEKEMAANKIAIRQRGKGDIGQMELKKLITEMEKEVKERK